MFKNYNLNVTEVGDSDPVPFIYHEIPTKHGKITMENSKNESFISVPFNNFLTLGTLPAFGAGAILIWPKFHFENLKFLKYFLFFSIFLVSVSDIWIPA